MRALLFVALLAGTAGAATIDQTESFPISGEYTSTAGLSILVPGTYFTTAVAPFDTTLGELTGVTITWDLTGGFSGTTTNPGGFSVTYVGDFLVNDFTVDNYGGGGGSGGPANTEFSGSFSTAAPRVVQIVSADPSFSTFTGSAPVNIGWNAPIIYSGVSDIANFAIEGVATVTVTYTYVPEPASTGLLALAGGMAMLRRGRRMAA